MKWLQMLFSRLKKFLSKKHSTKNKNGSKGTVEIIVDNDRGKSLIVEEPKQGIHVLYEDVKACQYEDVQILWSMVMESHSTS
ncbi:hypothetical protein MTR_5g006260 [Medicago truncatula]|uniref:Uncharacterized protein n=1 Tax=Medicago truncatula TaxID=3880 RepID=G7K2E2_MEDTR|nr:hypothetical protein MTR_5g006260 [Medicago truncatula]